MNITVGVVGCGNISRFHFSGLEKAGARVKWVCDISEKAAKPWADKFNARWTADFMDVVKDPEVNAVDVTAFSAIHKPVCLAAIKAGKAVICEKTLAENADDSLEIVTAAETRQTIFYTSYMKRFIPAVEKAKELLPSLGRVITTHIRTHQCWGMPWDSIPENTDFFGTKGGVSEVRRRYGGGILTCGGSHILDLVCHFLGRPTRLYSFMHTPENADIDLQAAALMETKNGTVNFEALGHPVGNIGFLKDGWDERIEITGEKGRLEVLSAAWDQPDTKASMLIHHDGTGGRIREYKFDPESPFDRAIAFFCKNIAEGKQGAQSRLTGYDVDELIAHIKRSVSTGEAVDIFWRG